MKKYLLLWLLCLGCTAGLFAQKTTISGTVTDHEGEPLVGAAVAVEGTTVGTITDFDGKFVIDAKEGTNLIVSYVGMVTQVVPAKDGLVIALRENAEVLDEVVVVGYGTTTRAQFVGSAEAVSGDDIAKQATSNITNALSGKVAGVQVTKGSGQPGTGASIRIRGIGSISGGATPLYVIDGVPVEGDAMNQINSHDIASMTVLKDASATAIYGARGANGVVLITTKGGSNDHKMTVNVDAKWGVNQKGVKNYDVMTSPELYYETYYKALYNSQAYNGASSADAHAYANANLINRLGYQVFTVPEGQNLIGSNFKLNPNATLGYSDGEYYYTPDNWEKEMFQENQLRHEYNVSVNGSNKDTQYFVSGGYLEDPGLISGSGFERFSLRTKVDSQVKKWLKVGGAAAYAHTRIDAPSAQSDWGSTGNAFYTVNMMGPIFPFYVRDAEGNIKKDSHGYTVYDSGTYTNAIRPGGAPRGNQAINLFLDQEYSKTDYFSGNLYLTLTPVKGLNLTARVAPEVYNVRETSYSNPFYGSTTEQGIVAKGSTRLFTLTQQYMADYKVRFADHHNLEVLAGWEMYSLTLESLSAQNKLLYNPFVAELSNAYDSKDLTYSNMSSSTEQYKTAGLFARLQYDLYDRYFLNATYRYEGSSRFAAENRWGSFGSVGAAWLISRENWFASDNVDELKLKASWGTQGNEAIRNYYAYHDLYAIDYNSETGEFSKTLSQKGNRDLTWEKQQLSNVGVDFAFFNNRLSGTVEYFNRYNTDMLFNIQMPLSAGYSSEPHNVGSMMNQGAELSLEGVIVDTRDVKWSIFGNITYLDTKIIDLPDEYKIDGIEGNAMTASSTSILREGGSLFQLYTVEYAGVDEATGLSSYYIDRAADLAAGKEPATTTTYADAKQVDLGDVSANWFGGFGTSLEAYGFDLSVSCSYQLGGQAYDGGYQELMHTGYSAGRNWHKDILNAWTPESPNSEIPRISTTDNFDQENSSRWMVSSNYLSLDNVTVGYTLPSKWTKKIGLQKLRVYFQGDNLALASARQGFDPRQGQNGYASLGISNSTTSGNYVYSQLRTLTGGISITF